MPLRRSEDQGGGRPLRRRCLPLLAMSQTDRTLSGEYERAEKRAFGRGRGQCPLVSFVRSRTARLLRNLWIDAVLGPFSQRRHRHRHGPVRRADRGKADPSYFYGGQRRLLRNYRRLAAKQPVSDAALNIWPEAI